MNYFFVFQNKTYNEESKGGYLWAPKHGENNRRVSHWDKMRQIKKGDIIIHSYLKGIQAISIAQTDCYSADRPKELVDDWDHNGWKVDTKYFFFKNYIITSDHMAKLKELQPQTDAPFNSIGRGNTGYLFGATKEMLDYIITETLKMHNSEKDREYIRSQFIAGASQKRKYNIPEVRIIPMSGPKEFENQTIEEIQEEFFLNDLLNRTGCEFKYRDQGLKSENNALLLFQMKSQIIACARLNEVIVYEKPDSGIYHGAYSLYPDSLQIFEPIDFHELKNVFPDIKPFSHTKQNLGTANLNELIKLIFQKSKGYKLAGTGVQKATETAEIEAKSISNSELLKRIENNKTPKLRPKSTTVVYYRDPYLKELVRRIAAGKCQLCHGEAPFLDKAGNPYLEEHHVKQLSDGGKDRIDNVVALCPNCHTKMHIVKDEKDINKLTAITLRNLDKVKQL